MPEHTRHEEGMFSYSDLATTDVEAATRFYVDLFGWHVEEAPLPEGGVYVMFTKEGKSVAAAAEQQPDQRAQGVPPMWNTYFTVTDVDQRTKQAEASGGTILAPPFDVMDVGRMSVIADPNGAVFCLWEARTHIGASLMNEPNTLGWTELMAPDVDKARAFYTEVLPWTPQDMDMGDAGTYTIFNVGDKAACGMYQSPPGMESMTYWMVYFEVADCDATVERVRSLGGQVHMDPTSAEGVGRFAALGDPQGAMFGVIQPQRT